MDNAIFKRAQAHVATTAGIREELIADRDKLVQQRAELAVRIGEYDKLIAELTPGASGSEPEPTEAEASDQRIRLHGVKRIVEKAIRGLHVTNTWLTQDAIVEAVAKLDVRVQQKSIVSALGRLCDEGVLTREGKRGSFRYAVVAVVPSTHDQTVELSPPELILGKLRTSGPEGVSKKHLSWVIGDVSLLDQVLDRLIADGEIRTNGSGASETYVLAERVQKQRPLFDGSSDSSNPVGG